MSQYLRYDFYHACSKNHYCEDGDNSGPVGAARQVRAAWGTAVGGVGGGGAKRFGGPVRVAGQARAGSGVGAAGKSTVGGAGDGVAKWCVCTAVAVY